MSLQQTPFRRDAALTLGDHKGQKRVYLSGKWLNQAGFTPGSKINVEFHNNNVQTIRITPDPAGRHKVSGKKDNTVSVIDIVNGKLTEVFAGADELRLECRGQSITITPATVDRLRAERVDVKTEASFFSGGGFLTEAAKQCGFDPTLAAEISPAYAEVFEINHPTAHMYNMSVHQLPWQAMKDHGPVGLFTGGICCEPFTQIRRLDKGGQEKRDKSLPPEAHDLGDMTFWCLRGIEALNPYTVVLEEVPGYQKSGAFQILMRVLSRWYRHVEARVINPFEYGSLTGRDRLCIVARDTPIVWPEKVEHTRTLGEIFDPEPHEWFNRDTKFWLFDHWEKQTAKGNGFEPPKLTADSPFVGTIKKRYFAQQGDNPVVAHPTKPGTYRWLTVNEVARLHGIPTAYALPEAKTVAGEIMGQGVVVDVFQKIIASVTGTV